MAKVTSKLQVTLPKAVADEYGIVPGDDIEFLPTGDTIRVVPAKRRSQAMDVQDRLRLFDEATARQQKRQAQRRLDTATDRGWTRDELYDRGRSR